MKRRSYLDPYMGEIGRLRQAGAGPKAVGEWLWLKGVRSPQPYYLDELHQKTTMGNNACILHRRWHDGDPSPSRSPKPSRITVHDDGDWTPERQAGEIALERR